MLCCPDLMPFSDKNIGILNAAKPFEGAKK